MPPAEVGEYDAEGACESAGISEPAVCKWETDSSMPDIMMLTPLARALHTDLNTLFSYEETLSPEKAKELKNTAEEIGGKDGTDAAMLYWKECLQEYPNSETLKREYAKWLMKRHGKKQNSFCLNVYKMH